MKRSTSKIIVTLGLSFCLILGSTSNIFASTGSGTTKNQAGTNKSKEDPEKMAKQYYMQALKNLEKSQDFTLEEKSQIREAIEENYKKQTAPATAPGTVTPSIIIVPGLPDTSVTTYTLIATFGKKATSGDIWYKNGYITILGSIFGLPFATVSTAYLTAQLALYAAGIATPFIIDNSINPIIQAGCYTGTKKYFKWSNPSRYEYAIRYDYKSTFTDSRGITAIWNQGSSYTYGNLSED